MNSSYTPEEERADAIVHMVGVGLAMAGAGWLFSRLPARPFAEASVLGFYAVALVGTLGISAAYNLAKGPVKDRLRRVDHAMIFLMIAATYAPFVVLRLPDGIAIPLGVAVGGGCAIGAVIKLLLPRRFDRLSLALYLGMGWAITWALDPLRANIGPLPFALLVVGGCLYTLGVPFYLMERLRFHNALWHACVLAGAAAHFATMAVEFG